MNNYSSKNTWRASDGERYTSAQVERKINQAKGAKIEEMMDEHGYLFCEDCKKSGGVRLDCSHDSSVDECKKSGVVDLAWSVQNITIRCRDCHQAHDSMSEEEKRRKLASSDVEIRELAENDLRERMAESKEILGGIDEMGDWY